MAQNDVSPQHDTKNEQPIDPTQTLRKKPLWGAIASLFIGLCAAVYLVLVKLRAENEFGYQSACNFGSNFDCDAVQTSEYALILGVPLAIWAIPTYFVMIVLAWFGLKDGDDDTDVTSDESKQSVNLLLTTGILSVLFAVFLAYIQHVKIGAFCLFCIVMYLAQLGAAIGAWMALPKGFQERIGAGLRAAFGTGKPIVASAGVFAVIFALSFTWYQHERKVTFHHGAQNALVQVATLISEKRYEEAVALVTPLTERKDQYTPAAMALMAQAIDGQLSSDSSPTMAVAQVAAPKSPQPAPTPQPAVAKPTAPTAQAKPVQAKARPPSQPQAQAKAQIGGRKTELGWSYFDVPITADDYVDGPKNGKIKVVMFADYECPYCRMLTAHMKKIRDKYRSEAQFIFKFYPMDGACNPRMGGERKHPNACYTAKASYCAGKQGKFWPAHDTLFEKQGALEPDKVKGYMKDLIKLDMSAWETCMASSEPQNRINTDLRLAARAGIYGTPRTYINNRLMSGASSVAIIDYYMKKALENPSMPLETAKAVAPTKAMQPMAEAKTQQGSFYIDRFEASIDKEGRAVSMAGVKPSYASWFEAKGACEAAGKRLCSEEEWASACTSAPAVDNNKNGWFNDDDIEGTRYPYGVFYDKAACHDGQKTLSGAPINTGAKHACRTKSGIYDMTGNIGEWIENSQKKASQVGGHFGAGEGAACNRRGTMFGPGIKNNTTGFRCCADKMVANATTDPKLIQPNVDTLIGLKVPEFTISTTDGQSVSPATWKGKVSYITFFASWCGSCKRELPELKTWVDEFKGQKFQVVAIGVDRYEKSSKDFAEKYEPNFPVALDPEAKAMGPFNISAMPTSFVVDKGGVIRHKIVGFKKEEVPATKAVIKKLL